MSESSAAVIRRYLENASTAERSLETHLHSYAAETRFPPHADTFRELAAASKSRHEKLDARSQVLGGHPPASKGFLSHLFEPGHKTPHHPATDEDSSAQHLIAAFALAKSQSAIYEVLSVMAEAASDPDTALLARSLQAENKSTADTLWRLLSAARVA